MIILEFTPRMKVYQVYFYLNLLGFLPLLFCFTIFADFIKEDHPAKRACLPIACFILVIVQGALVFQTLCMMIKYKSLTDRSDKKSNLPQDQYANKKSKDKYEVRANNDVLDDDDLDSNLGMMGVYLLIQIIFLAFWIASYFSFNKYVQGHLPADKRQKPSKWLKSSTFPMVASGRESPTRRVIN